MKKLLSGVIALVLLAQFALPVFAQEAEEDGSVLPPAQAEDVSLPEQEDEEPAESLPEDTAPPASEAGEEPAPDEAQDEPAQPPQEPQQPEDTTEAPPAEEQQPELPQPEEEPVPESAPQPEEEPEAEVQVAGNDSWNTATPISVNKAYSSKTVSGPDEDWYKFTLAAAGPVSISFGNSIKNTAATWRVSIHASTAGSYGGDELFGDYFSPTVAQHNTMQVGLPAGTFYLRVNPSSSDLAGLSYNFTLKHTANAAWESEFNNGWSTADPIVLNSTVYGATERGSDDDWYVFTLPAAGPVSISFANDHKNTSATWRVSIHTSTAGGYGGDELFGDYFSPTSTQRNTMQVGLPAGTFFLRVNPSSSDLTNLHYSFVLNYTANAAWESEFNNGWSTADPIVLNSTVYGATERGSDDDWYVFTLPAAGPVSISFANDHKNTSATWRVSIHTSTAGGYGGDELFGEYFSPTITQRNTMRVGLPAGTFFLRVNPSSSDLTNLHYNFVLNYTADAAWESEFNNGWSTADPIALNSTVYGSTERGNDDDWYQFTMSASGKVKIKLKNDKKSTGVSWVATIYEFRPGGYGNALQTTQLSPRKASSSSVSLKLKKGNYYLCINPGSSDLTGLHYNFSLNVSIPLKSIKLSKTKLSLIAGKSETLSVTSYSPANTNSSKKAKWSTSNAAVASVSSKGKVKGLAPGTAVITCTVAGVSKTCKVTVKAPTPVSKVSLKQRKASLAVGESLALTATVSPKKATNKAVKWKSSNKKVAVVSSNGVVTALKPGKATITVTTKDGKKTAKCKITVR